MLVRRARIVILARRRSFEYLAPLERISRPSVSPPGPAASHRVPCDCASLRLFRFWDSERREKERFDLVGRPGCRGCDGSGWRERVVGLDGPLYTHDQLIEKNSKDERGLTLDEFTYGHSLAVATRRARELGEQQRMTFTERELGQQLDRLATTWPSLADPEDLVRLQARDSYSWERARQRYLASGSFAELERALGELRMHDEILHQLFLRAYCHQVYGFPPALPGQAQLMLQAALDMVDGMMPEPIRIPDEAEQQLAARDRGLSVAAVYAETGSLTKTSRRCGIGRTKVREIVRKAGLLDAA